MNRIRLSVLLSLPIVVLALSCQNSEEPGPDGRVVTGSGSSTVAGNADTSATSKTGEQKTGAPTNSAPEHSRTPTKASVSTSVVHGFELAAKNPGNLAKTLEQGVSLQKQGKYKRAIEVLGTAVAMKGPEKVRAEALVELAETYFRQGKDAQSEKLDPGEEADADSALTAAADLFDEVVRRFPKEMDSAPLAAYMSGSSYLLLGDQRIALEKYTNCYESFPNSSQRPRALLRRGVCYAGTGNPVKARELYTQYVNTYSADPKLKNAVSKVRKYIYELNLVGAKAPTLRSREWLRGVIPNGLADLRGEVVVVTFFMTGCGHCKNEMPKIRRDIEKWTPRGVVFIGTSDPDHEDAKTPIDVYLAEHRINFFEVAIDSGGKNEKPFHVRGYPASVIIDRKGIVRWRGHYAFLSHSLLATLLDE